MTSLIFDYVASLEASDPGEAVANAVRAEEHGFDGTFVADRFAPWLPAQNNASFVWTVLGALGERTRGGLTASAVPGYRMHPAAVAQASATTAALYPGRHSLVLSAGNAIDEHVVGGYWPESHERMTRLIESAELVHRLFSSAVRGTDVRFRGSSFQLETSRLWTAPVHPPTTLLWSGGPVSARRAAKVADGIAVFAGPAERMRALIRAAQDGARDAGKDSDSILAAAYVQVAWAPTVAEAEDAVLRDWPMAGLQFPSGDIRSPFEVAQLVRSVTVDDIRRRMPVTSDPVTVATTLSALADLGFRRFYVHNVLRRQHDWIEVFGSDVRPLIDALQEQRRGER